MVMLKVGRKDVNPNRCQVCGRRLRKSQFIGPGCMRKRRKYVRTSRINKKSYIEYERAHDIFNEEELGGSKQASKTSKGVAKQKTS